MAAPTRNRFSSSSSSGSQAIPAFAALFDIDEYKEPELGSLVTHNWNGEAYRTGVLHKKKLHKKKRVRFFGGYYEGYEKAFIQDFDCVYDKESFNNHLCLARLDLVEGNLCYDWGKQFWCLLMRIDVETGGVYVAYERNNRYGSEELISPDQLVGVRQTGARSVPVEVCETIRTDERELVEECGEMVSEESTQTHHLGSESSNDGNFNPKPSDQETVRNDNVAEAESSCAVKADASAYEHISTAKAPNGSVSDPPRVSVSEPVSKRRKSEQPCYYGVFSSFDTSGRKWYIRGKLQEPVQGSIPLLLLGERVSYIPGEGIESQFWEYNERKNVPLIVVSAKDKKKCKVVAIRGEREYAERLEGKWSFNNPRSTSFPVRRGQPVVVVGTGIRNATVLEEEQLGTVKIKYDRGCISTANVGKLRLIGFKLAAVDLDEFFRRVDTARLPTLKADYSEEAGYILDVWKKANGEEVAHTFIAEFDSRVKERNRKRQLANQSGDGCSLTASGALRISKYCETLLRRLQEDVAEGSCITQIESRDLKRRITDIKIRLPNPNMLLLCGGFAPELTAYKRLGAAPIGKVILQDIDLFAVGVAVACHPDVEFFIVIESPVSITPRKPGDVGILMDGRLVRDIEVKMPIHHVSITNPCQSFSLAGRKEGFQSENGQLLYKCCTVLQNVEAASDMPTYLAENVPSTHEINQDTDRYQPHVRNVKASYFKLCSSMCSPCVRRRKFATNRPPGVCSTGPHKPGKPPSLDGNHPSMCAMSVVDGKQRMVHPDMKKFPCQLSSNATKNDCVWEQKDALCDPKRVPPTPEEAERAMGYREDEIGVTAFSARDAVEQRIKRHDYCKDGCLVSLKDCAIDPKYPMTPVGSTQRLSLLGNSECVTLLEALMWNDKQLFPPILEDGENT